VALDIDGFAILRTIGVHPHIFKAIAADAVKAARTLVVKQIAHRNTVLKTVRDIRAAVGPEAFSLIMDGMTDAQIKSLATRLDKHAAPAKVADGTARRHVLALADGSVQPADQPPEGAVKAKKTKKAPAPPKQAGRIQYESAGARRKQG
jgi:hypothetical protein